MSTKRLDNLREFHRFIGEIVHKGGEAPSPEEVLDEWRALHPEPEAVEGERVAIEEAIADLENGDTGIPFEEFDREFRERHKLPHAP